MRSKRFWRPLVVAALIATLLGSSAGCHPQFARVIAASLIAVAAVAVLAHHDDHFHHHHCGHTYVVVEEREVYHYQDRWEYYDEGTGEWYYYDEPPVPDHTYEYEEHHHYHYRN